MKKYRLLISLTVAKLIREGFVSWVWAQEEELNLPEYPPPSAGGGGGVLQLILAFLLVLAALWGFYYLLRRFGNQGPRRLASKYVSLIDFLPVKPNFSLYLFQVGERVILVAQTGNTIREIADFALEDLSQNPSSTGAFSNYLDRFFGRKKESGE